MFVNTMPLYYPVEGGSDEAKCSPCFLKKLCGPELSMIEVTIAGYYKASQVTGSLCLNISGSQKLLSLIHLAQLDC
jgi:hypothetical protein